MKNNIRILNELETATLSFKRRLNVKLQTPFDYDLLIFYKKKNGEIGGVFSYYFRGRNSDLGNLNEFPYMFMYGELAELDEKRGVCDNIGISNLDDIECAYVCVLLTENIFNEDANSPQGYGRVEIWSDNVVNFEFIFNAEKDRDIYHVCTIKNYENTNYITNENVFMDFNTAIEKIPGFYLICEK